MSSSSENTPGPSRKIRRLDEESEGSEQSEDGSHEFDEETQKALEEMDRCQNEAEVLNEQAAEEIMQIEQKFSKLRIPIYTKRGAIIEKISNFWVTALVNHPQLSVLITEEEEDCLHFLSKLEVEEFENIKTGYRIKLHFEENPFFEDKLLVKEFNVSTEGEMTSTSSEVHWKDENKNLSKTEKNLDMGIRAANEIVRKGQTFPKTFFFWFTDNSDVNSDEIGETIKDDLWPNPLQYYLVPDVDVDGGLSEEEDEEVDEEEDIDQEDMPGERSDNDGAKLDGDGHDKAGTL